MALTLQIFLTAFVAKYLEKQGNISEHVLDF